ncbi:hypothetical protein DL546_004411 [Coniochaeta pulveracea]|uniref:Uncharacterized protein n=1 Tax=Coniochaeta pulveracea TaxID=177199 RepID=A0A420Y0G6_9PEZI|nr:hypothetical protein DL546_004411 [Coniochaeta pulveracea]
MRAAKPVWAPINRPVGPWPVARVPVPFSIFPSSYKEGPPAASAEVDSHVHEEVEIKLPHKAGREGQYSSYTSQASAEPSYRQEEVHITREEDYYRRPGVQRLEYRRRPKSSYSETHVEFDKTSRIHDSPIDLAEREYRARFQPNYKEEVSYTVDGATRRSPSTYNQETVRVDETVDAPRYPSSSFQKTSTVVDETTVDVPAPVRPYRKDVTIIDETVEIPRKPSHKHHHHTAKMGYYDDEAPSHVEYSEVRSSSRSGSRVGSAADDNAPSTVTIPCHHIRLGDILILQGRPCQVIRISTSAATGQHRYLGVDLFTKQLHEESSSISHPAPSVVVQTMLGPIFKQYRVLDIQDGSIVAMTETGDVKQNLPVIEQSNLWSRLQTAFEAGRGSVRVLVVSDRGRELAVDMKVVHGSRL